MLLELFRLLLAFSGIIAILLIGVYLQMKEYKQQKQGKKEPHFTPTISAMRNDELIKLACDGDANIKLREEAANELRRRNKSYYLN